MKVFAYSVRKEDEGHFFKEIADELGVTIGCTEQPPTLTTVNMAAGFDYISIVITPIDSALIERFRDLGVKMISTRSVGFDHIDLEAAKRLGMPVGHATYSPGSVADYTIMLMLACLRNFRAILRRADIGDYTWQGLRGRELSRMTVGVVGAGHIGAAVIQRLTGFGCRILVFDTYRNEQVAALATYTELQTLLRESDVVSLHVPGGKETDHMLDAAAFAAMKHGAVLINAARGSLVESEALIKALESGQIAAAGLDTIEGEGTVFSRNFKAKPTGLDALSILKDMPNVILTPHVAFYTETAVREMVEASLKSCVLDAEGKQNPWRIQ